MSGSQKNSYGIPLSLREWLVCIFATLTLVFTAWSLGGYKTWALHLLFAGGMGTFLASIFPMPKSWNGYDQQHGNLKNLKRLLLQPFFWAGLCFLVYILIQYFNPSIVQVFGEKSWWVERMTPPLGANLPSSVKADYETMNALRTFVIQASAISLACGILVGIQRRKSALIILWFFVISGVTMSFVAILQKLSGTDKILWLVDVTNESPWGSFAYRNQGAAFLILLTLISGLLYFFYASRYLLNKKKGDKHFIFIIFIFLLYGSIWGALSRSGIILGSILIFGFCLLAYFNSRNSFKNIALFICLAIWTIFTIQMTNLEDVQKRIVQTKNTISDIQSYDRVISTKATWVMAQDRLIYGWGAGSFRYIFPIYQKKYDSIWYYYYREDRGWIGRKIYNYAHNDWVQFLAEYGFLGCSLLFLMILNLLVMCGKIIRYDIMSFFFACLGIIIISIENLADFIFSSPSYWVAFWGTLILVFRLFSLEQKVLNCNND